MLAIGELNQVQAAAVHAIMNAWHLHATVYFSTETDFHSGKPGGGRPEFRFVLFTRQIWETRKGL